MRTTRVAINGFGRIGRAFFKIAKNRKEIEIVAINDLGDLENLAYLLRYDTAYGKSDFDIAVKEGKLVVDGKEVIFLSEREP
ncbi:MAG: type I glyceraldehyde-3-phosphate dehydrogenase, partial [Candidatus Yonathbacteria bacterium]|nr:type I glyceraldehyde-3-phosphate dehydrogenase [Candidatus Yonathbacteria bacterium]